MIKDDVKLTLTDENNEEFEVVLLDSVRYDEHIYSLLTPADQADDEECDVIILEYKEENGEILFLPVENDVLLDEIWQAYNDSEAENESEN